MTTSDRQPRTWGRLRRALPPAFTVLDQVAGGPVLFFWSFFWSDNRRSHSLKLLLVGTALWGVVSLNRRAAALEEGGRAVRHPYGFCVPRCTLREAPTLAQAIALMPDRLRSAPTSNLSGNGKRASDGGGWKSCGTHSPERGSASMTSAPSDSMRASQLRREIAKSRLRLAYYRRVHRTAAATAEVSYLASLLTAYLACSPPERLPNWPKSVSTSSGAPPSRRGTAGTSPGTPGTCPAPGESMPASGATT
jgi:hypothetical protein